MEALKKFFKSDLFKSCIIWFILYSFIGWFYEVFLEVVIYKWGFSDRGVLFGPYCPVYGFGSLLFIFLVYPLIKSKGLKEKILYMPFVFVCCALSATLLELITSYLCEWFMGSWPWQTYSDYAINFQGRIALSPSIRFGLGGTFFLYVLQPLFEKVTNTINKNELNFVSTFILFLLLIDVIFSFIIF